MATELIHLKSIKEADLSKKIISNHCVVFISPEEDYLPEVGSTTNAGWDIKVDRLHETHSPSFYLLGTNVKYTIPPGYELQLRLRSGTPKKYNFMLSNSVGTLDSNYRGEILAGISPLDTVCEIPQPKTKFAQIILTNYFKPTLESHIIMNYYMITNKEEYDNWETILPTSRGKDGGIVRVK